MGEWWRVLVGCWLCVCSVCECGWKCWWGVGDLCVMCVDVVENVGGV